MSQPEPTNLKRAAVRGIAWKITAEAVTQVTRIVLLVVLARVLVPSDFGVASLVLAFVLFVRSCPTSASGPRYPATRDTEVERSTVFWASVALGVTFCLVGIALSVPLADIFDEPQLQPLFSAFSACFVIASLSSVPNALLMRAMNFRSLEIRVMASTLFAAAVALTLAFLDLGAWAIVGGEIANRTASLVMLWSLCAWRPTLHSFSWPRLRSMLAFSGGILGAHSLQFAQTIQNLMVGRLLGAQALGRLTVSQTLVLLPFSRVAAPYPGGAVPDVLPHAGRARARAPRLESGESGDRRDRVARAVRAWVLAPEFTDVVLGDKWQGTDEVIRALAFSGVAVALQRLAMGVLSALAYYRSLVWIGLGAVGLVTLAVAIGSHWGLTATAVALSIQAVTIQAVVMTTAARSVGARFIDVIRPLGRIALAAVIMAAAVAAVAALLRAADVGSLPTLVCGVLVGAAVYLPLVVLLERQLIAELADFFRARRARPAEAEVEEPVVVEAAPAAGAGEARR